MPYPEWIPRLLAASMLLFVAGIMGWCLYQGMHALRKIQWVEHEKSDYDSERPYSYRDSAISRNIDPLITEEVVEIETPLYMGGNEHDPDNAKTSDPLFLEVGLIFYGTDYSVPQDLIHVLIDEIEVLGAMGFDLIGKKHLRTFENLRNYLALRNLQVLIIAKADYYEIPFNPKQFQLRVECRYYSIHGMSSDWLFIQDVGIIFSGQMITLAQDILRYMPHIDLAAVLDRSTVEDVLISTEIAMHRLINPVNPD